MLGKNNFLENNRTLLIANVLLTGIIVAVGILYRIESEFLFYETGFMAIVTISACVINNSRQKKNAPRSIVQESDKRDTKWEAMREKEDFFALWTHQIKTPIAALKLLLADEDPDIGASKRELFKIENYVEMALNYLRFEGMSGDMVLERIRLEPLVKQVVKKYSTIFIHKHLKVELSNLDVEVLTDEKWISFVLEQILSNALKYTQNGGVTIFVRKTSNPSEIEIVVSDTGVGIKSGDLPRVFEKGYTGYNGRIDKKASGLGLYLCKGVCDKLGHKIRIESEEGKGTEVTITVGAEKVDTGNLTKM